MDLPIKYLILFAIAALTTFLSAIVFIKGRGQKENAIFATLLIFVVFWVAGLTVFGLSSNVQTLIFAAKFFYASASLIPAGLFYFSLTFLSRDIRLNFFRETFIFVSTAALIYMSLAPGVMIESVVIQSWGNEVILKYSYYIYTLLYSLISVWAFANFVSLMRREGLKSIEKLQLRYALAGIGFAYLFGSIFNLILPLFGNYRLIWLGPYFLVIMAISITYAIVKHRLLNIRLIATELFTGLMVITFLVDVMLSSSLSQFMIRLTLLVLVSIFGFFLIRGTLREIRELERLSEAKSTFVSIASHQLRAPLTAIKGFISMIKEGSGSEGDRAGWLEKAYISNERLIRLVNDLLNVSRIERGKIRYNFKDADIVNIIDEVVEEFYAADGFSRAIEFKWKKPEDIVPEFRVDAGKLRQVFVNLIDNAIRYTNQGWIGVRIVYLRDLKKVRIVVQDTGIGMSKEDMRGIFDLFERGESGQKASVGGMGIGLYFAKEVIKAHRGRIWAESDGPGKGSKFYVELPIA